MNYCIKILTPLTFAAAVLFTSCSDSKTSSKETQEISTMDSTEKVVKENIDKLEEQTKKVENSLEKLDKEFENDK